MNQFLKRSKELEESMKNDRHYIHQHAEIGQDLEETTKYIMNRLKEMGIEAQEICKSGIVALVGGKKPGKTYLLRADMDALAMSEENTLPFKSLTGNRAHNCGHDIHTSMLLATAQMLKEREDEIEGTVKLMFQPAEEIFKGAEAMIEAGVLENPKVDAASAMHVMLDFKAPAYACCEGFMATSCDGFTITIHGVGCHGAMPHLGVDPINVGLHIYSAYQELVAREVPPNEIVTLTFGQFSAGNTNNVIPATAELKGTLRTYNKEIRKKLVDRMKAIVKAAGDMFGVEIDYEVASAVPPTYSDPELLKELKGYLEDLEGLKLANEAYRMTPSDDMAFISEKVPTVYLMLGAKVENNPYPHHSPKVLFNEDCMVWGAAIHAQCAFEWLKNNK